MIEADDTSPSGYAYAGRWVMSADYVAAQDGYLLRVQGGATVLVDAEELNRLVPAPERKVLASVVYGATVVRPEVLATSYTGEASGRALPGPQRPARTSVIGKVGFGGYERSGRLTSAV